MKRSIFLCTLFVFCMTALGIGCGEGDSSEDDTQQEADAGADVAPEPSVVEVSYNFERDPQGWEADVTDFPVGSEPSIEFTERVRPLPDSNEIDDDTYAYYLEGQNSMEEIFMFIRRQIGEDEGIEPDTEYLIDFEVTFATNYPEDCSDGEKAFLKLGGHTWKPARKTNQSTERIEFNVRKGNDENLGGKEASVAGDIAHERSCDEVYDRYIPVRRNHSHNTPIKSASDGTIWLIAGIDSAMSGENRIYLMDITATLTEVIE